MVRKSICTIRALKAYRRYNTDKDKGAHFRFLQTMWLKQATLAELLTLVIVATLVAEGES